HESQISVFGKLRSLDPAHQEALWGSQELYRAMSTVNGGRKRERDLFEGIPSGPVTHGEGPAEIRRALSLEGPLPEEGTDGTQLLLDTAEQLFAHSCFNAHPRFFGYITAPPAPVGVLGD